MIASKEWHCEVCGKPILIGQQFKNVKGELSHDKCIQISGKHAMI
jgi:hypothetical protein